MTKRILLAVLIPLGAIAASMAHAAPVPCEDMLKQLRASEKTANLAAADKSAVAELEQKGIERCNADDDKRANKFFEDALKLVTKK